MTTLKTKTIDAIIKKEGGYSNDPEDAGGETNFGINAVVAKRYGWARPMKELPRAWAVDIYSKLYWDSLLLDEVEKLSPKIAEELADTGVNMGTGRATEFLQRSLNALNNRQKYYKDVKVDGAMGGQTLDVLKAYLQGRGTPGEAVLLKALNCLQGEFYISLAERRNTDEKFLFGWLQNRIS